MQRRLAPMVAVVALAAVGLLALGYLLAVSGLIRVGSSRPTPSPAPSPTPSLQDVLERVQTAAVTISASTLDGEGSGSGFVAGAGGIVLTNAHVVKHAFRLLVVDRDGNTHKARVVGLDDLHDVAALKATGLERDPLLLAAGSTTARVGTEIYVVGNPGGHRPNSVVKGLISATGRDFTVGGRDYHGLYQLDTSNLVPGSSGSPVITADGRVVGIDALGDADVQATRFAFAIPVAVFRQETEEWTQLAVPLRVNAEDLPWQTNPGQAVVQLSELRSGYSRESEAPTQFSATAQPPPSDDVVFRIAGSGGGSSRRILSRVIVYATRPEATSEVAFQENQFVRTGAIEQPSPQLGQESQVLAKTSTAGITTVTAVWRDRNVMCLLQFEGAGGEDPVQKAIDLASGVEQRILKSQTLDPDA